jgi:hypothetical protein
MGNSGDEIRRVVLKRGELGTLRSSIVYAQGSYLMRLGAMGLRCVPEYLGAVAGGYLMEELYDCGPWNAGIAAAGLLRSIGEKFWRHSSLVAESWNHQEVQILVGDYVPEWVSSEESCCTHGDLTLANLMVRPGEVSVVVDPVPPGRRIPSLRSVDHAGILQSLCGWEVMLERWLGEPESLIWPFPDLNELELRRALYWLGVKAKRIESKELSRSQPREPVLRWADRVWCNTQSEIA